MHNTDHVIDFGQVSGANASLPSIIDNHPKNSAGSTPIHRDSLTMKTMSLAAETGNIAFIHEAIRNDANKGNINHSDKLALANIFGKTIAVKDHLSTVSVEEFLTALDARSDTELSDISLTIIRNIIKHADPTLGFTKIAGLLLDNVESDSLLFPLFLLAVERDQFKLVYMLSKKSEAKWLGDKNVITLWQRCRSRKMLGALASLPATNPSRLSTALTNYPDAIYGVFDFYTSVFDNDYATFALTSVHKIATPAQRKRMLKLLVDNGSEIDAFRLMDEGAKIHSPEILRISLIRNKILLSAKIVNSGRFKVRSKAIVRASDPETIKRQLNDLLLTVKLASMGKLRLKLWKKVHRKQTQMIRVIDNAHDIAADLNSIFSGHERPDFNDQLLKSLFFAMCSPELRNRLMRSFNASTNKDLLVARARRLGAGQVVDALETFRLAYDEGFLFARDDGHTVEQHD